MSIENAMLEMAKGLNRYAAVLERLADAGGLPVVMPASAQRATTETNAAAASDPAFAFSNEAKASANSEGKPKRGRPKKEETKPAPKAEEPEIDDSDDFGDDEADDFGDDEAEEASAAKSYTADQIRNLLMKVKDKHGADEARAILAEVGVKTIASIPEKDYPKVVQLAAKKDVKL